MKQKVVYCCEFCSFEGTSDEVLRHEAGHYGLSVEEYKEWMQLDAAVKKASYHISQCRNERMEQVLDGAVQAVLAFEKAHGLNDVRLPIHSP